MHQEKKSHLETLNKYMEKPKVQECGRGDQASERTVSITWGGALYMVGRQYSFH